MKTNNRSIKTRMVLAESKLGTQIEQELVTNDIKAARKCWGRLVDWAHEVYKAGGFEAAVEMQLNPDNHKFDGMLPGWDISALLNQVYGRKGGGDSLLYPLSEMLGEFFADGGLSEELKKTGIMMAVCESLKMDLN